MANSVRDNLPLAPGAVLPEQPARTFSLRAVLPFALTLVALLFLILLFNIYQNAAADTPSLQESTLGQLGIWMAERSGEADPPSLLGQFARNQALAQGLDRLEPSAIVMAMRAGLVVFIGLLILANAVGLVGLLIQTSWARTPLVLALIGLDLLIFIVPPLENESTAALPILGALALSVALLAVRAQASKLVGFVVLVSSVILVWEGLKAFGTLTNHQIALPQPGWNAQVYPSLEDALTAVQDGSVPAAILDENEVEDSIATDPVGDLDPAALPYPDLRILTALETRTTIAGLPIAPGFPGRLVVVTRADSVDRWQSISELVGQPIATYEGAFSLDRFLALPRNLVLVDLKITNDLNMPHLQTIAESLLQPARRNGDLLLVRILADAGVFTWTEAALGFVSGALLGFLLGTLFAHSGLLERGLLPFVVASQTVPILAIAPMVVIWLGAGPASVAVISMYLTFFPVTINTLRGLTSPNPMAIELMQSYAASRWTTLWKLRFPAALPYIFTALKVSATASVVGAIIGELPSGIRGGLGGAILNFNQYYTSDPTKLWAAIFIAALVGIFFFLLVTAVERVVLGRRVQAL
ncbi:MAG: ABC transporter permease subunit [Anaerolineae bacterium]|nr:ABC transporter permease subunit [Anaerolineae bacterium]